MSGSTKPLRILFLTAEQWPTFRPDVAVLFGKYLPRHGIHTDLVTERETSLNSTPEWGGGSTILCGVPVNRAGQYLVKFWHQLRTLFAMNVRDYDAVQVRDMSVIALVALVAARARGLRFFYWLSYPQSEGQIARAKARGLKGGMRFWFPLFQGMLGRFLLYRIVLPRADHVFVQSRWMQAALVAQGIPHHLMTPVPMAVDTERAKAFEILPADDRFLSGKRILAYLGTLDSDRNVEILFHMLARVREAFPDAVLLLIGDTADAAHRTWLHSEAKRIGIADHVYWTGWLEIDQAWRYVKAAEIGLSPIPRGVLLDMASPTKAVEYMALGLPVVVNDNPDQAQVIEESGAGICVPLDPSLFATAVLRLMRDAQMRTSMSVAGPTYVDHLRSYRKIAEQVALAYRSEFSRSAQASAEAAAR